jgi:hypothetical protein
MLKNSKEYPCEKYVKPCPYENPSSKEKCEDFAEYVEHCIKKWRWHHE